MGWPQTEARWGAGQATSSRCASNALVTPGGVSRAGSTERPDHAPEETDRRRGSPVSWSRDVAERDPIIEPESELCKPSRLEPRLLARPCTLAIEESLAAESARVCEATPERREQRPVLPPGIGSEPEEEEQEAREWVPRRISRLAPEAKSAAAAGSLPPLCSPPRRSCGLPSPPLPRPLLLLPPLPPLRLPDRGGIAGGRWSKRCVPVESMREHSFNSEPWMSSSEVYAFD